MKKSIFTLSMLFVLNFGLSQVDKSYLSNRYSLERMGSLSTGTNSVLPGLPASSPEVMGDPFLKPNQAMGILLLYNDQVFKDVYSKYDLIHDDLYFFTKQGTRVVAGTQVKSFILTDSLTRKLSTYINAKEFKMASGAPLIGFFEILYDGHTALLKRIEATINKANYNVALSVGRRDHTIAKKIIYFYLTGNVATELPAKKLTTIFGNQQEKIDRFIKVNGLNVKDERHLILVFEHYNQLEPNN